jgi:hypothetical protein
MRHWISNTSTEPERAQRFVIAMPLRYRLPGEDVWHQGNVQNISRSGVLFRAEGLMDEGAPIELTFQLPVEIGGESAAQVYCLGKVVRAVLPPTSDQPPALVVLIHSYQFVQKGTANGV